MARTLHLLLRAGGDEPSVRALDLLQVGRTRVLELFDATLKSDVADLSLAERDLPEVTTALHWAQEVHAHGIHPEVVLRVLPAVKPQILVDTPLVLHGPWAPLRHRGASMGGRLQSWPGVVRTDGGGDLDDVLGIAGRAVETVKPRITVDVHRATLVPSWGGAAPMRLGDGRWRVVVTLGAQLTDEIRDALGQELPNALRPGIELEVRDERKLPSSQRARARRRSQVYVTSGEMSDHLLEAVAQELPIIAVDPSASVGERRAGLPTDAVCLGGEDVVDRVVACVRSWRSYWARGEAAPVNTRSRRVYLDEHVDPICLPSAGVPWAAPTY